MALRTVQLRESAPNPPPLLDRMFLARDDLQRDLRIAGIGERG